MADSFPPVCVCLCERVALAVLLVCVCVCGHAHVTICEFVMCILSLTFSRAFPFGVCAQAYCEECCEVLGSIQKFIFSFELSEKEERGKKEIAGLLGWENLLLLSENAPKLVLVSLILHTADTQTMADNQRHLSNLSISFE